MNRRRAMSRGLALAVCGGPSAGCRGRGEAPVLRVAAASGLQPALSELERAYRAQTNGAASLQHVVGSSGALARQVRQGAPFDLFLSADRELVRELAAEGIVRPGSVRAYAIGVLALAVHRSVDASVERLADLTAPAIQAVAIADPRSAPFGRAARQVLERTGLWETMQPKLVLADTVWQAFQFVESGNAEAGLVSASTLPGSNAVRAAVVGFTWHDPIVQELGIVATTRRAAEAEAYCRLILGPTGRRILERHGFSLPALDQANDGAQPTPTPAPAAARREASS